MLMKKIIIILLIMLFALTSQIEAAKRRPIVVPTQNSYTLVGGAYLWPVHGFYSIHPTFMPQAVKTIVYLPAWNGVYWYYTYVVRSK